MQSKLEDKSKKEILCELHELQEQLTSHKRKERVLKTRDAILSAVGFAAEKFLLDFSWLPHTRELLKNLGHATEVDHVHIMKITSQMDDEVITRNICEWKKEKDEYKEEVHAKAQNITQNPRFILTSALHKRWIDLFKLRQPIYGTLDKFPPLEEKFLQSKGIKSFFAMPIYVGDVWWGLLCFKNYQFLRPWSHIESEALLTVCAIIGNAICRGQVKKELVTAKTIAEDASRAKSEFLANMSHEIRTPISGVMGAIEVLLSTPLNSEQRKTLEMTKTSTHSLLTIINDILDFSKIEARKLELMPTNFNLHETLEKIVALFTIQKKYQDLQITLTIHSDIPQKMRGDSARIGQVVKNLLSNALKFTKEGSVNVEVCLVAEKGDILELMFSVKDTGIGISPDRVPHLFQSFSQIDDSYSKKYGGTGLGLAISRKLSKMMGGDMWVESVPEKGSTFHFRVSLEKTRDITKRIDPSQETKKEEEIYLASREILLVEDNELNQKFLCHFLARSGHKVFTAINGLEALEALDKKNFDIILMDIQMPKLNGLETTKRIRNSQKSYAQIPIIALTAYAIKGEKEKFLEAGMNDYLSKPIDIQELYKIIHRVMTIKSQSTERKNKELIHFDKNAALKNFGEDMSFWEDLRLFFIEQSAPQYISQLEKSLAENDMICVKRAAHSMKGASGTVNAVRIKKIAEQIEEACDNEENEKIEQAIVALVKEIHEIHELIGKEKVS